MTSQKANLATETLRLNPIGDARSPSLRAGWEDARCGRPPQYDAHRRWPINYECGRLLVVEMRAAGLAVPAWYTPDPPNAVLCTIDQWREYAKEMGISAIPKTDHSGATSI